MKPFAILLFFSITVSLTLVGQDRSRFDQWDKNGDGKLSKEELPVVLRRNFEKVDRDSDGSISRAEDAAVRSRNSKRPGTTIPEAIEKIADIDYAGTKNPRQALDLYLPSKREEGAKPLPVLVFIHGGGWKNGDKRSGQNRIGNFVASAKYAGASIGYRLSDEAQWPSQIHDCKAAIRWIRANAKEHGLDPDRIAVWGTSAGGHLVAMLGVSDKVEELEGAIGPHVGVSSEVQCVVNFFGPSELLTMNDHPSTIDHNAPDSPESKLIGGAIQENPDKARNASPIAWVSEDDEPSLIVHGTEDKLVPYPQSVDLEKALEAAGVPTVLLTVQGGGHGSGFGPAVNSAVEAFLAKHLRGSGEGVEDGEVEAGK